MKYMVHSTCESPLTEGQLTLVHINQKDTDAKNNSGSLVLKISTGIPLHCAGIIQCG